MAMCRSDIVRWDPRRWYNKPVSEKILAYYKKEGYIDDQGNITPLGKEHHVVKEKILGTETREHYEKYAKYWEEYNKKMEIWAGDERIPWDECPEWDYVETWPSEQE